MAPEDQAIVDGLTKPASSEAVRGNYTVRTVDLDAKSDEPMRELWAAQSLPSLPWMVVRYPHRSQAAGTAWCGHLTVDTAKALVDSPVRREVAKRLSGGEAAVWILLESGDKAEDDRVVELLQTQLKQCGKDLHPGLPGEDLGGERPGEDESPDVPITFSMVRLSRTDPAEQPLASMLLHSEDDLPPRRDTMAFPVFGRGRVLYALAGKGINEQNVREACAYLVEGCSCEVKAYNPGTDLLMAVDWEAVIAREEAGAAQPPQGSGSIALPSASAPSMAEPVAAKGGGASGALLRNSVLGAALGLAIVAAVALILRRRDRSLGS